MLVQVEQRTQCSGRGLRLNLLCTLSTRCHPFTQLGQTYRLLHDGFLIPPQSELSRSKSICFAPEQKRRLRLDGLWMLFVSLFNTNPWRRAVLWQAEATCQGQFVCPAACRDQTCDQKKKKRKRQSYSRERAAFLWQFPFPAGCLHLRTESQHICCLSTDLAFLLLFHLSSFSIFFCS